MGEDIKKDFSKIRMKVIFVVSILFAAFHLYTAITGTWQAIFQRSIHYMFAGFLVFMMNPLKVKKGKKIAAIGDIILSLCAIIPVLYLLLNEQWLYTRFYYIAPFTWYEYMFCAMLIISILEGTRRKMGIALPLIASIAMLYMLFGQYLPGTLGHSGFTIIEFIDTLYTTTEGIWGVAIGASATFVILFVIFGSFLEGSGVGDYFINFAKTLTRKSVGGPAKAAVVSSAFFGSISGSCIANVATTGQVTIPMMKKNGYSPTFAASVEAVASTGGQIMPPVMGSAAFIMSEFTGIPYSSILLSALLPAILFYLAVYTMVHLRAKKMGLEALKNSDETLTLKSLMKDIYMFLPLVILVIILVLGYSPTYSVLFGMATTLIILIFSDWKNKIKLKDTLIKLLKCLVKGAQGAVSVALACACAGIVVGVINYTGVGAKLSTVLLSLSQNNVVLALILTAVAALVLGMGLPTTPAYIVVATLLVPAIIKMGLPVIAAHLFGFYFANISNITPPVALAAYTASSLAGSDPMKTGYQAFKLGIASYIVPFMFALSPVLLLIEGSAIEITLTIITSIIGVTLLGVSVEGFLYNKISFISRTILFIAAVMFLHPSVITDFIAIALGLAICFPMYIKNKKPKANLN